MSDESENPYQEGKRAGIHSEDDDQRVNAGALAFLVGILGFITHGGALR